MPTVQQRRAAKALVGIGGKPKTTIAAALREAEYSAAIVDNPQKVTQSKGFKDALAEFGLTEELITCALVDDIKAKPKRRVRELELGSDLLQMRKRDNDVNTQIIYNVINYAQMDERVHTGVSETIPQEQLEQGV